MVSAGKPETTADRFCKWRAEMGLSLGEVQKAVNEQLKGRRRFGLSTVSDYEAKTQPPVIFLEGLARAFPRRVNIEHMVFGAQKPSAGPVEREEDFDEPRERPKSPFDPFGPEVRSVLNSLMFSLYAFPEYRDDTQAWHNRDPVKRGRPLKRLERVLEKMATAPFEEPDVFVELGNLRQQEATAFFYSLVAAVFPLIRAVRTDTTFAHEHPGRRLLEQRAEEKHQGGGGEPE